MKLAAKYYLNSLRNSLLIAFAIVFGIILFIGIIFRSAQNSNPDSFSIYSISGFESTVMIFTLVSGLVSFREAFRFFQQNGISRKSQFMGWAVSLLSLSIIEAIFAILSGRVLGLFFNYNGAFDQLYYPLQASTNSALLLVQEFLWVCMTCLFIGWLGFAIAILYYRLSKIGKILVSILVPGSLLILLPIADQHFLRGGYSWLLKQLAMLITGYLPGGIYPMVPVISALVGSAVLVFLSWLMMRRAEVQS